MTTFYSGPPLIFLVFLLAIIEAVLIPVIVSYSGSWKLALGIGVAVFILYWALVLIVWSPNRKFKNKSGS